MSVVFIGGLDPLGRSGLMVDLRAGRSLGVAVHAVCTALTAQDDEQGKVDVVAPDFVRAQLQVCLEAQRPQVVKLGWLASAQQLEAILAALPSDAIAVVDPVLKTSSGIPVYGDDPRGAAYQRLMRRADLLTPNLDEAALLLGAPIEDAVEAASALQALGPKRVLLKGGHGQGAVLTDTFLDADGSVRFFRHPRVPGRHRGTGCRLASLVAAQVCSGCDFETACETSIGWLVDGLVADDGC